MLELSTELAMLASGLFLVAGILTGGWKYHHIRTRDDHQAPIYVNIAHQASLAYAFTSLVVAVLAQFSGWPEWVNTLAVVAMLYQFLFATTAYVVHGFDRSMRNQFAPPHRLGALKLSPGLVNISMVFLFLSELGGAVVLLSGFIFANFRGD